MRESHGHHHHHHRHCGRRFARRPSWEDGLGHDGHGRRGRGRHGGHGEHGGRRGRSGRLFDHGELRLVVLHLIGEQPRHGYEIIKEIEERTGGTYSPSPGVVYPTLTMLEELGHATVSEADGKKLYAVTDEGREILAANQPALDGALERMRSVHEAQGGGPAPEILRATENLKLALRLRLSRGPLSEDQIRTVAGALDAATLAIERA